MGTSGTDAATPNVGCLKHTIVEAFTEALGEEPSVEVSVKASTTTFGESYYHESFHGSFHELPLKLKIVQVAQCTSSEIHTCARFNIDSVAEQSVGTTFSSSFEHGR